ncbi:MAG TPA: polysaccharide ABC transporter ATP-binding protein [Bacteroidales bacterium]|nr:polysaccharide ABC transporter ATP-binding protein [Bacteroidales bacterium]
MPDIAIQIESLSKQYRLGTIGTGTLSHDLKRWWTMNVLGKEDPNLRIGEVNDRSVKAGSEFVWALKNINLEIEKGDIVGIIGKNGSGKSTLLKILSRVTSPSTGQVRYKGRLASLLEVGTGFHWEMTGKENIYMNGSIMGMTRHEITRKLDEIIAFAGVEKYIDTPVKRYSSGMVVRLGFSVAAHLEPEILLVDEVLAVGDAEFQRKAIGKMQDVSRGAGRTVLFVSHNMSSIKTICNSAVLLNNGGISKVGEVNDVVDFYTKIFIETINPNQISNGVFKFGQPDFELRKHEFLSIKTFCDSQPTNVLYPGCSFRIEIKAINAVDYEKFTFGFVVKNSLGDSIIGLNNYHLGTELKIKKNVLKTVKVEIQDFPIYTEDHYTVDLYWGNNYGNETIFKNAFNFIVKNTDFYNTGFVIDKNLNKVFLKNINFSVQ